MLAILLAHELDGFAFLSVAYRLLVVDIEIEVAVLHRAVVGHPVAVPWKFFEIIHHHVFVRPGKTRPYDVDGSSQLRISKLITGDITKTK